VCPTRQMIGACIQLAMWFGVEVVLSESSGVPRSEGETYNTAVELYSATGPGGPGCGMWDVGCEPGGCSHRDYEDEVDGRPAMGYGSGYNARGDRGEDDGGESRPC
jgi:hypothetical protein